jgi:hypothetical protein
MSEGAALAPLIAAITFLTEAESPTRRVVPVSMILDAFVMADFPPTAMASKFTCQYDWMTKDISKKILKYRKIRRNALVS